MRRESTRWQPSLVSTVLAAWMLSVAPGLAGGTDDTVTRFRGAGGTLRKRYIAVVRYGSDNWVLESLALD